jgi:hypothetical protein
MNSNLSEIKVKFIYVKELGICVKFLFTFTRVLIDIQGDQKISVHLMITIQKFASLLPQYLAQSDCLAADRQGQRGTRLTLTPSVMPDFNYVIMASN